MILCQSCDLVAADGRLNVALHSKPAGFHFHLLAPQVAVLHLKVDQYSYYHVTRKSSQCRSSVSDPDPDSIRLMGPGPD